MAWLRCCPQSAAIETASMANSRRCQYKGRDGGTGRRSGLKIRRGQPRGGSTPPPGTTSFPFQTIFFELFTATLIARPRGTAGRFQVQKRIHGVSCSLWMVRGIVAFPMATRDSFHFSYLRLITESAADDWSAPELNFSTLIFEAVTYGNLAVFQLSTCLGRPIYAHQSLSESLRSSC